jgi:hypothetical protein
MKLNVLRHPSFGGATVGKLYIDGAFTCNTLEDEVREIPGQPVHEWKIKGNTAIPSGTYRVALQNSPRFGRDTLTLLNVPGFEFIRIHAGNTAQDTEGCLLLGMRATDVSIVGGTSRPAVELVKAKVKDAIERGEVVEIDIQNPTEFA